MDVVDLGEVAHTVIRARHHPDHVLNPSAKGWRDRCRPLHLNPPSAPNGGIRALKSPDAASLAADARATYERALAAQKAGDWAKYGEEIRRLGEILSRMK